MTLAAALREFRLYTYFHTYENAGLHAKGDARRDSFFILMVRVISDSAENGTDPQLLLFAKLRHGARARD